MTRLLVVPAVLLLNACSEADDGGRVRVDVQDERRAALTWEEFRSLAIRPSVEGTVVYAMDGDVFTDSESVLREYYDSLNDTRYTRKLAVFQRLSTGFEPVFGPDPALQIRYCVSDQFAGFAPFSKAPIVTAMQAATQAWQDVANVVFVYVPSLDASCTDTTAGVEFAVIPSTYSGYSGCAANKLIWINLCPVTGPFSSPETKGVLAVNLPALPSYVSTQGLLMHELGHVLGFRHEHPWGPAGCGQGFFGEPQMLPDPQVDVGFRRLTDYDLPSVMHYQGLCGKQNVDYSLSVLDGEGSRSVYGMPAAWYGSLL